MTRGSGSMEGVTLVAPFRGDVMNEVNDRGVLKPLWLTTFATSPMRGSEDPPLIQSAAKNPEEEREDFVHGILRHAAFGGGSG